MTPNSKRKLGLKSRRFLLPHYHLKRPRTDEPCQDPSFTTVALPTTKDGQDDDQDGLTLLDLVQLKNQAQELIDNPTGIDSDDDQLVNLLRGICHEAVRQIDLFDQQEEEKEKDGKDLSKENKTKNINSLPYRLLAWAALELGLFIESHSDSKRFLQPDEPQTLDSWISMSQIILDGLNSSETPGDQPPDQGQDRDQDEIPEDLSDLKFTPQLISLLKADTQPKALQLLTDCFSKSDPNYCETISTVRMIDRFITQNTYLPRFKPPAPIFNMLIEKLYQIRSQRQHQKQKQVESQSNPKDFQGNLPHFLMLIDKRLGDCHLHHASILAEELEKKYFPSEKSEEETEDEEEEFPMGPHDPTWVVAMEQLRNAEEIFARLLKDMDDDDDEKCCLKHKYDETLITMGNLTAPGPERENLYARGGLGLEKKR